MTMTSKNEACRAARSTFGKILSLIALAAAFASASPGIARAQVAQTPEIVAIPGGGHGLAFDDISYSPALERTLIPSASTGTISLI